MLLIFQRWMLRARTVQSSTDVGRRSQGAGLFVKGPRRGARHDWLWRCWRAFPTGRIGIFNRSYYEEVLVVKGTGDPRRPEAAAGSGGKDIWDQRYEDIRAMERHLARNGTLILSLSSTVEGRAEEAVPGAHRRPGEELEIRCGRRKERATARVHDAYSHDPRDRGVHAPW